MEFCKVENGEFVEGLGSYPVSIGGKKYGSNMPLDELIALGAYPLEKVKSPLSDKRTKKYDLPTYDVQAEKVVATYPEMNKTQAEIDSFDAKAMNWLREKRDSLLQKSDWSVLPDSPLTTSKKDKWKTYRRALRDLPDNAATNPYETTIPTEPAS